jgi:hypothetical protein
MIKRQCLVFLFTLGSLVGLFAQQNANLKFNQTIIQIGNVHQDSLPVSCNFSFSNSGTDEFKVNKVESGSGITLGKFTNTFVLSKGKGFINLIVNKGMRIGKFSETIKVFTGKGNIYCNLLTISGNILPREKSFHDYLEYNSGSLSFISKTHDFKLLKQSQQKTDSILVFNSGNSPVGIGFEYFSPHLACVAVPDTLEPGKTGSIAIQYNTNLKNDFGPTMDTIILLTDDTKEPRKYLFVKAHIVEDFAKVKASKVKSFPRINLMPYNYHFGTVERGQEYKYSFSFTNNGNRELIIHKVYCENPWFSAAFPQKTKAGKGGTIEVSLKVPLIAKGKFKEKMLVITNDFENPEIELILTGEIK